MFTSQFFVLYGPDDTRKMKFAWLGSQPRDRGSLFGHSPNVAPARLLFILPGLKFMATDNLIIAPAFGFFSILTLPEYEPYCLKLA